jgi:hypothetical protein
LGILRLSHYLNIQTMSVLKINTFTKLRVIDLMTKGPWSSKYLNLTLLPDLETMRIEVIHHGQHIGGWDVSEQPMPALPLIYVRDEKTGEIIRKDRSPEAAYYVYGKDRRRYRYIYLRYDPFDMGTRTDLFLRYPTNCRSHWQRTKSEMAITAKLLKEKKQQRLMKKLEQRFNSQIR